MSRQQIRQTLRTIICSYIVALFCLLPNASDIGLDFGTKGSNDFRKHSTEATDIIENFREVMEKFQSNKEIEQEDDTQKIITLPENFILIEEPIVKRQEQANEDKTAEIIPESMIDSRLPGVVYLSIDETSPESPILLSEQKITETDIVVDLSEAIDPSLEYVVSEALEICISKIVFREAGTQPFLGKVFVAEGVVNRLRSGVYGSDVLLILQQGGYGVEMDENGNFHIYRANGSEVLDIPEADIEAAKIALRGSTLSNTVLKTATDMRNNQYGIELGEECYRYGCIYHYNPDLVSDKALNARTINRVPVSFRYVEHVFYGYWLNAKYAMNII